LYSGSTILPLTVLFATMALYDSHDTSATPTS
jgi:hypothetical protein